MIPYVSTLLSAALLTGATTSFHHLPAPKWPTVIEYRAKDFALIGPKSVKSGPVTFRLVNDGKELHHITVLKLGKGKTLKDLSEALKKEGPPPAWVTDMGGPNAAAPGGTIEATLNLAPGEYALACFIPSPGSPMPHMMKGMVTSLTVLPQTNGATMPVADVTLTASDFKYTFSKPLTAGKHVINFVNTASQSHEVVIVKLAPGKTAVNMAEWAEKEMMKGPPPGEPMPGIAAMAKGQSASFPIDLKPGTYGLICFVPDAKDGKSHAVHGMTTQFVVK
jgi:hypothetical protein